MLLAEQNSSGCALASNGLKWEPVHYKVRIRCQGNID